VLFIILDANDRVVVNDAGTMKQVTMTDVMTYVNANVSGGSVALDDIGVGDAASTLATTAGNITIDAQGTDTDIIFKGTTGGVDTTFLTLDGSDGGTAIFNSDINLQHTGARIYFGATDQTIITHQQQTGLIISLGGDLHSNEPRLTLSSTGSTNNKGPQLYFTFDTTASHAPSDDDVVGSLKFQGDAGKIYGLIENAIENASNPSGRFDFYVAANNGDAGSYGPVFTIKGSTTTYGEGIVELGGNLDVNGNDIVTTSNADLDLAPHGSGVVVLRGNTTGGNNPGAIKLNCEQNTHGITIKSPLHSSAATYTLTLPDTDGNASEVLQTDGSGNLSWVAQSSGGGGWTYSAITADPANAQAGYHYSCTGTFTITLPTSGVSAGEEIRIKNMGTGTITLDPQTQTIDGSTSDYLMTVQYSSLTLVATGSGWEII
jgi:hypothetical protein